MDEACSIEFDAVDEIENRGSGSIKQTQRLDEEACSIEFNAVGEYKNRQHKNGYIAWRFMIRETDHIRCKICSHKLKLETSTSDMLYHIQMNHEFEYNEIESNSSHTNTESNHERGLFTLSETSDDLKTAQTSSTLDTTTQGIKIDEERACSVEDNAEEDFKKSIGKSIVWRFMIRGTDHVKCKICGHKFKKHKSTSNLLRHIHTKHERECNNEYEIMPHEKEFYSRSIVWEFMIKETDCVKCKICEQNFKFKTGDSTTNLLRHIKHHHILEYNKVMLEQKRKQITPRSI